jgi:hypothetical protein
MLRLDPAPKLEAELGHSLPAVAFTLVVLEDEFEAAALPVSVTCSVSGLVEVDAIEARTLAPGLSQEPIIPVAVIEGTGTLRLDVHQLMREALCSLTLIGRVAAPGSGELCLCVGDARACVAVTVRQAAPLPLLKVGLATPPAMFAGHWREWAASYAARSHCLGWIGLDAEFTAMGDVLFGWLQKLLLWCGGDRITATLARHRRTTTVGECSASEAAAWANAPATREVIEVEGLLRLTSLGAGAGELVLVHQPRDDPQIGITALRERVALPATHPRLTPLELYWAPPRPPLRGGARQMAAPLDRMAREASRLTACVGVSVLAGGPPPCGIPGPFAYPQAADASQISSQIALVADRGRPFAAGTGADPIFPHASHARHAGTQRTAVRLASLIGLSIGLGQSQRDAKTSQ